MPKHIFLSFILALTLLITAQHTLAQPSSIPFSDLTSGHPYFQDIVELQRKGLVEGYGDGTFRPDQLITRAEFVKLVLGAGQCLDCSQPPDDMRAAYTVAPFPDVVAGAWYFYCVAHGKKIGLVTGYLGEEKRGLFVPEDAISRAESVAILLRAVGIAPREDDPLILHDVLESAWYKGYVKTAVSMGLIPYHNGFVAPEEKVSRAEFAHLTNLVMQNQQCTQVRRGTTDTDGDGIEDNADQCPTVPGTAQNNGCPTPPENLNGNGSNTNQNGTTAGRGCPELPISFVNVPMQNGCPILDDTLATTTPGITVQRPECNQCPCPTADYRADLRAGDVVFSIIANETNQTIYTKSNLYYISE